MLLKYYRCPVDLFITEIEAYINFKEVRISKIRSKYASGFKSILLISPVQMNRDVAMIQWVSVSKCLWD